MEDSPVLCHIQVLAGEHASDLLLELGSLGQLPEELQT